MKKQIKKLILIAVGGVLLIACKKYDEGPALTLRSKKARVANTWVFESYMLDGVDSTAFYAVEGTELTLDKEGNATGTQIRTNGIDFDTSNFTGTWEFAENDEVFGMILTDDVTLEIDTNWWWIRKLKNKEFWLEEEDNGQGGIEYFKWKEKE